MATFLRSASTLISPYQSWLSQPHMHCRVYSSPTVSRFVFQPGYRWSFFFIEAWQAGFLNGPPSVLRSTVHSICRWPSPDLCSGFPSRVCLCLCHSTGAGRARNVELIKCVCWIPGTCLLTSFTSLRQQIEKGGGGARSQWPWNLRSFFGRKKQLGCMSVLKTTSYIWTGVILLW